MAKKPIGGLNWILANNPGQDNTCKCFQGTMPNRAWIAVKRFETYEECASVVQNCNDLFMQTPAEVQLRDKMGKIK